MGRAHPGEVRMCRSQQNIPVVLDSKTYPLGNARPPEQVPSFDEPPKPLTLPEVNSTA